VYCKIDNDNQSVGFPSFLWPCHSTTMLDSIINLAITQLENRIVDYTETGSNWVFEFIKSLKIEIMEYTPFSAGAGNIKLPPLLDYKLKSLVNVPADDSLCFKRSVEAHFIKGLLPSQCRKRKLERKVTYNQFATNVNWSGINFPFTLQQIAKFEKINPNIGLCIIGYSEEKKKNVAINISGEGSRAKVVRLQ